MSENFKKEAVSWIFTIIFAVVFAVLINNYVIVNAVVPTGSMVETIMPNDRLVANRLSYVGSLAPKRGDVIVFKFPDNEEILYVKRVIGLPGETIEIVDGLVYINNSDTPLEEPYLPEPATGSWGPALVPEGAYFAMGDNRNHSEDARFWDNTYVYEEKILGKAIFRYFPKPKLIK